MTSEALDLLRSKVAVAALHNSGERYDAPRCHPGTRLNIQADIMEWLDDVDEPELVLWMHGSAGVGKSAIAHAIASLCYDAEPRRLAGAFFLSRTAPTESRRGDEKYLVATLAYQMANNIPCLELHIATAILKNRFIFELNLETQIKELILNPLAILSEETWNKIPPMIFVIDALDECSPTEGQGRIIRAFVAAIRKTQHNIPIKLLIASRPESHIKSTFGAVKISPLIRSISLDDEYKAEDDIRKFLADGFSDFRRTHPSPSIFPLVWPEEHDIDRLAVRSTGQFIYASTTLKYIQENGANPILRLRAMLDLAKDPIGQPFTAIDALYSHIFGQVKDLDTVLSILCISYCFWEVSITFCDSLLGLPQGSASLALQDLSSVGKIDKDEFQAYHASLHDFLEDEHRAGDFYVHSDKICVRLSSLAFGYMSALSCFKESDSKDLQFLLCVSIIAECTQHIPGCLEIHKILSTFNMDIIFRFIRNTKNLWLESCSEFFGWLVWEHRHLVQSDNRILLRPFSQLHKWTSDQLKRFQFDNPLSRWQLDYLENTFLCRNAEIFVIQKGILRSCWVNLIRSGIQPFEFNWVAVLAPQALTEDRIVQLMSQYCYYILNSSWLNIIRNECHADYNTDELSDQDYNVEMCSWMVIFSFQAPSQIDLYLDIQHILGLNSLASATASAKDLLSRRQSYSSILSDLVSRLYSYLEKVEKEFSCLTSPLNKVEETNPTAAELVLDRPLSLPYIPQPSDSASFALALTFHKIWRIEYRDTEF